MQARSYDKRKIKWSPGRIEEKEGIVLYIITRSKVRVDDGQLCRKHIGKLIKVKETLTKLKEDKLYVYIVYLLCNWSETLLLR